MGAVHGHAADRVEQHDVVDDGLDRREPARRRPASPDRARPRTSPCPRRTWTSSARIDRATSSAVSPPRSRPAGARKRGEPFFRDRRPRRGATRGRPRRASARRRAPRTTRHGPARRPSASSSQTPCVATTTAGAVPGSSPAMSVPTTTRSAPGKSSGSAIGSKTETRQPAAEPSVTRARGDGRRSGHPQDRRGQMRFHVDLQRAP